MAWLAVDKDGTEIICPIEPTRGSSRDRSLGSWIAKENVGGENVHYQFQVPSGTIFKLIGKTLTWEDKPVELKS